MNNFKIIVGENLVVNYLYNGNLKFGNLLDVIIHSSEKSGEKTANDIKDIKDEIKRLISMEEWVKMYENKMDFFLKELVDRIVKKYNEPTNIGVENEEVLHELVQKCVNEKRLLDMYNEELQNFIGSEPVKHWNMSHILYFCATVQYKFERYIREHLQKKYKVNHEQTTTIINFVKKLFFVLQENSLKEKFNEFCNEIEKQTNAVVGEVLANSIGCNIITIHKESRMVTKYQTHDCNNNTPTIGVLIDPSNMMYLLKENDNLYITNYWNTV